MPILSERVIETSFCKDSFPEAGLERMVLEAVSNHLDAISTQSGGEVFVFLEQEGEYVYYTLADKNKLTTKIQISDNGPGYDPIELTVLSSSKADQGYTIGQFGEGAKLGAVVALQEGIELAYYSKNWGAVPFVKVEDAARLIEKLCFNVVEFTESIGGSLTMVHNPPSELVDLVLNLGQYVLKFNDAGDDFSFPEEKDITESKNNLSEDLSYKQYLSRIIDLPAGTGFYVKGIKFSDINSIFSYDLGINDIPRGRDHTQQEVLLSSIRNLLLECDQAEVITKLLTAAEKYPYAEYIEFQSLTNLGGRWVDQKKLNRGLWKQCFHYLYGDSAVIGSNYNSILNQESNSMGRNPITLNPNLASYLQTCGVETSNSVVEASKQFNTISEDNFTPEEKNRASYFPRIIKYITENIAEGDSSKLKDLKLSMFSSVTFASGREDQSILGYFIEEKDGQKSILVRRDLWTNPREFIETCIHEIGHGYTGAGDYTRLHSDFGYRTSALALLELFDREDMLPIEKFA